MTDGGPCRWWLLFVAFLSILNVGCPGRNRQPRVSREVIVRSSDERKVKEERMKGNVYQRDQLFRHLQGVRGGR